MRNAGKGPDVLISCIEYIFNKLLFYPEELCLFFDNCSGENKNNYLLWYLNYITYHKKLCKTATANCMITGHTKCSCDRNFGII